MEFIKFNSPAYLIIAALAAVTIWLFEMRKARHKPLLKTVVICLILTGLSEPMLLTRTDNQCVLFAVDVSQSVNANAMETIKNYIASKIKEKRDDDRIGMLQFRERARLVIPPSELTREELLAKLSRWSGSREAGAGFTDIENALLAASKLFPEGFQKRLVLITDGNENMGDASKLFYELKAMGITVDILPVGGVSHDEVIIESVHAPQKVRAGSPFIVEVLVRSNTVTEGHFTVSVDGEEKIIKSELGILPGNQRHSFPLVIDKGGFHDISVSLSAKKDGIFINNSAEAVIFAAGKPTVLIITDPSSDNASRKHLGNILTKNNIDAVYMPSGLMPADVKKYISYDTVILDNIPSLLLSREQMKALSGAVHDIGTGILLIGGDKSLGAEGFAGTPIESALPFSLIPSKGERPSSLDLVFIMDKSGSMSEGGGGPGIELAADAMQSIIDMSGDEDTIGIIAFDSESHVIAGPGSIKSKDEIINKIQAVTPRGSTDLYPAMAQAYDWLKRSDASHKHVILLSDGRTRERDFSKLLGEMREKEITISAVAAGRESDITLMKDIARMGEGRFFQAEDDLSELSKIFQIDAAAASRPLLIEKDFTPRLKEPDVILSGMPHNMPKMNGYMATSPKKGSVVPVVSHLGDPVVGFWNYGLGRAVVFTGDDGLRWSRDWLRWEGFGRLLLQMAKRSMIYGTWQKDIPLFRVRGNHVEILRDVSGNMPMKISAKILSSDGETLEAKLFRSANGQYTGTFDNLAPGKYTAVITEALNGEIAALSKGHFIISDKEEYLTLERNDKLMENIASHTEGRILKGQEPLINNAEKKAERFVPVRPYLFILAVILFLADVAVQRKSLNHSIK
ncbi:MAG: VWA domain-containing protein [Nitrospirae bacterium]|nr:VWA domain-containing protein [Nitrospirota bacterium]